MRFNSIFKLLLITLGLIPELKTLKGIELDVGRLNTNIGVSPTGDLSISLEIDLPEVGNKFSPQIGLAYNNQARSSYVGHGWQIQGLSQVTRCPANIEQDGFVHLPNLSGTDRFCLDGQKLIAIEGEYGADRTTYRTYRDSLIKVVSHGTLGNGPRWFRVYQRNGEIADYGINDDSRLEHQIDSTAISWGISAVRDRHSNFISFEYLQNQDADRPLLPKSIHFGGNEKASLADYRRIDFVYGEHPLPTVRYQFASPITHDKILKQVDVVSENRILWSYKLHHFVPSDQNLVLVDQVTKCIDRSNCLRPTRFNYRQTGKRLEIEEATSFDRDFTDRDGWTLTASVRTFADLNGNGYEDLIGLHPRKVWVRYGSKDGLGPLVDLGDLIGRPGWRPTLHPVRFADLDQDGFTDIIIFHDQSVRILYGKPGGFESPVDLDMSVFGTDGKPEFDINSREVRDLNQSGFPDLLAFNRTTIEVAHGTGRRDQPFSRVKSQESEFGHRDTDVRYNPRYLIDLNQSGFPDILVFSDDGIKVSLGSSNGFSDPEIWNDSFRPGRGWTPRNTRRTLADVNGDGISDIVAFKGDEIWVLKGTGEGFEDPVLWLEGFSGIDNIDATSSFTTSFDINGDGFSDFIAITRREVMIVKGTGAPIERSEMQKVQLPFPGGRTWIFDQDLVEFFDKHALGRVSLAFFIRSAGQNLLMQNRAQDYLITRIEDGLGRAWNVDWSSTRDAEVYESDFYANYPVFSFHANRHLVRSISSSNGVGGLNQRQFIYRNGRFHKAGLGFLGFAEVIEKDLASRVRVERRYSQDPNALGGLLLGESKFQLDRNLLLERSNYLYRKQETSRGVYFVPNTRLTVDTYGVSGHRLSRSDLVQNYDGMGNLRKTELTVTDQGSFHKTTTLMDYDQDDVNNWLLGKPTRIEVVSESDTAPKQTRVSSFRYHPTTGALLEENLYPNTPYARKTTYTRHPSFGHISTTTLQIRETGGLDFDTVTSRADYDARGFLVRSVNPEGHVTKSRPHPLFGISEMEEDANGLQTIRRFDGWMRTFEITQPDGVKSSLSWKWCDLSCPTNAIYYSEQSLSGAGLSRIYYDVLGRELRQANQVFGGQWSAIDTRYLPSGLKDRVSRPYYLGSDEIEWTSYRYDFLQRPIATIHPDGSTEAYSYSDFVETYRDPNGHEKQTHYNALQQVVMTVDALGQRTRYEYDVRGNLTKTIDINGNVTEIVHDDIGRVILVDDPSAGVVSRKYNGLDLVYESRDPTGIVSRFNFDRLGRKVGEQYLRGSQVLESASWEYDRATNGIGSLARASKGTYQENYLYDRLSRPSQINYQFANDRFQESFEYDEYSRLRVRNLASGIGLRYHYDQFGQVQRIVNNISSNQEYWRLDALDPTGQVQKELLAGQYSQNFSFDPQTGRLLRNEAVNSVGRRVHQHSFRYDGVGNVVYQENHLKGIRESYEYDALNRLTIALSNLHPNQTMIYDGIGNILQKSVGANTTTYRYGSGCGSAGNPTPGPYAVCLTEQNSSGSPGLARKLFEYDRAGRIISDGSRRIEYSPFGKPSVISTSSDRAEFVYGPGESRIRRIDSPRNGDRTETLYVGDAVQVSFQKGQRKYRTQITDSVFIESEGGSNRTLVNFSNHIGNVIAVADSQGNVVQEFAYDPWGKRLVDPFAGVSNFERSTLLGFTGHEHIDELGLIHMNGRVYDPELARFISPDPYVQDRLSSQSFNRYAYVWNNPLSNVDPSGYISISPFSRGVSRAFNRLSNWLSNNEQQIYSTVIMAATIYFAPQGAYAWYAAGGFASGYVGSDGDVRAATISAFTTVAFVGVGDWFQSAQWAQASVVDYTASKIVAHGMVGGMSSVARGGDFRSGFAAGAISEAFTLFGAYEALGARENASGFLQISWNAVAAGVVGGMTSQLTGGSFESGFQTAATGRLFNALAHSTFDQMVDHMQGQPTNQSGAAQTAAATSTGIAGLYHRIREMYRVFKGGSDAYNDINSLALQQRHLFAETAFKFNKDDSVVRKDLYGEMKTDPTCIPCHNKGGEFNQNPPGPNPSHWRQLP